MSQSSLWDPLWGYYEPAVAATVALPDEAVTADSILARFSDGVTQIEYRFAAAWRRGVVIGKCTQGEYGYVAVRVNPKDADVAYVASRNSKWLKTISPVLSMDFIPVGTEFVLVRPDQVRPIVEPKAMPSRPHFCPRCNSKALIMTNKVSCPNYRCANYDKDA